MRRFLPVFPDQNRTFASRFDASLLRSKYAAASLLTATLMAAFPGAAPISAQTKPSVKVPATNRTQSQALVQQLLREGKIMRGRDVKRGMTGYGLSVFQGTTIEKFPIEIIGVLESVNGGGDFVLFRVTGGTVIKRQSSIVAGMSGSPVYINGKLLGAISIGFGFPKEAIGGITPITDMIETALPDPTRARRVLPSGATKPASQATKNAQSGKAATSSATSSTRSSVSVEKIGLESQVLRPREALSVAGRNITRVIVSRDRTRLALSGERGASTMTMHPATMLLQVSGISASALPRLQKTFAPYGIEPIMGAGTSFGGGHSAQVFNMSSKKTGVDPAFVPGGAIGAQMVSGDMDMTGVGTITYRIGNRVLAFGHPMLGLGDVSLPMTSAYIHDIFPSYNSSFKLASPVRTLGAIQQDTNFAIGGTVGVKADTIPMTVSIRNSERQIAKTYRVQIMKDAVLTPQLVQSTAAEMIDSTLGKDNDKMVSLSLRMKLRGQPDIVRRNLLYAPSDIASVSLTDLGEALMVTQSNSFARGAIEGVQVDVNVAPVRRTARIKSIFADRNKVKAGQSVRVSVELEPTTAPGTIITKTFTFAVPTNAPTGVLRVAAGNSGDYWGLATRVGDAPPDPQNLHELLDAYAKIGASNELMVQASTPSAFLLVDRTKIPNPPASWSRLLRQSSSSSVATYNETQTQRASVEYSISGNQFLTIPVESVKHSDQVAADGSGTTVPPVGDATSAVTTSITTGESAAGTAASGDSFGDSGIDDDSTIGNASSANIGGFKSLPARVFGRLFGAENQAAQTANSAPASSASATVSDDAKTSATPNGFASFENALRRGIGRSAFAGAKFSPIVYPSEYSPAVGQYSATARPQLNFEYSIRSSARFSAPRSAEGDAQIPAPTPAPIPSPMPIPPVPSPPAPTPSVPTPGTSTPGTAAPQNPLAPSASQLLKSPTATPIATPAPTATPVVDNGVNLGRPSSRWTQSSAVEFTRGDFNGTQVTSEGAIQISPRVRQIATTAEPFAWSVAGDNNGNAFVGTGNNARLFKIARDGSRKLIYNGKEVAVTALAVDASGALFAGVSPGGRVLKFAPNSETPTVIFRSNDTFIWALKLDAQGHLLIGTGGERGKLYRINATRNGISTPDSAFATVTQKHIRAIAIRGNDIFCGTSDDGVLYHVDGATGKTTALYEVTASASALGDFASAAPVVSDASSAISVAAAIGAGAAPSSQSGSEILAVAALPDGVYFGTSTSGSLYRWTESGVSVAYPTPQNSIYSLQVAPDGSLLAGTGEKGIVYQFRTGPGANGTSGARLLEPTQTQALALAVALDGDLLIGTGNNAAVYRAALGSTASGLYTSNVFDAKNIVQWGAVRTIGSGVALQTRSGNTLDPDATWSAWQDTARNDLGELRVLSPPARYLQYRATLNSAPNDISSTRPSASTAPKPSLSRIEVTYRGKNNAPQVAWTSPAGGEYWNGTKKLNWQAQDADNDRLRSTVSVSNDDGATWKTLDNKTPTMPSLDFDSTKYSDGNYRFKVETSDVLSNPDDPQTDTQISAPLTLDNTAPTVSANWVVAAIADTSNSNINAAVTGAINSINATATDAISPISGAEWRFVGADVKATTPPKTTSSSTQSAAKGLAKTAKTDTTKKPVSTKKDPAAITLTPAATPATPDATPTSSADWQALSATDGIFDSRRETLLARIENSDLEAARVKFGAALQIEVRVRDAAGNSSTTKFAMPPKNAL